MHYGMLLRQPVIRACTVQEHVGSAVSFDECAQRAGDELAEVVSAQLTGQLHACCSVLGMDRSIHELGFECVKRET